MKNTYHLLPGDEVQVEFENGMSVVIEHQAGALGIRETSGHIICVAPKSSNYLLAFPQRIDYRGAPAAPAPQDDAAAELRAALEQLNYIESVLPDASGYDLEDLLTITITGQAAYDIIGTRRALEKAAPK